MRNPICTDAVHAHRSGNVLERLVAQILEGEIKLTRGILLHARGDTDAAGLGQCFEPCSDVHPVSPSSTTTSPTLMPIRNSMRLSVFIAALRSAMTACTSVAQRSASTTLLNSARKPSPVVLTSRP